MTNMSITQVNEEVASPVWRKAMVTFIIMGACVAGQFIPLPTIHYDPHLHGIATANCSIMALGLDPLLKSFLLVEWAALLVPAWQPLRVGGPRLRGKLRRAAIILGLSLTAGQAFVLAIWAERAGVARNPGLSFRLFTIVTLLGAAAVLILLAQQVDRRGLGNGFSVLILASFVPGILRALENVSAPARSGMVGSEVLLNGAPIVAGLVATTLWMFGPYRLPIHGSLDSTLPVRLPACGAVPIMLVPALFLFLSRLANPAFGLPLQPLAQALRPGAPAYVPTVIVLTVTAVVLLSWLFNRPDRVASTWRRLSEAPIPAKALLKVAMLESTIFVLLILLGMHWLSRLSGAASLPSALTIVVATGILLDLVREARSQSAHHNLVPVWEIHQLYAVDPAMRLLASEGIRAFPRGLHHRTLLQFFGPFVPVHILVEAEYAPSARALLQSRWDAADGSAGGRPTAPSAGPTTRPPDVNEPAPLNPAPVQHREGKDLQRAFKEEVCAEWEHVKEKCPHCGRSVPFTATICPSCGQAKLQSPQKPSD